MESLYRKYRPLTFESVVGQQHIVATLEHAVTEGRLSHAYLFCGPRGTGKTTMARILAKALLCQRAAEARDAGGSGCLPDGTCEACRQIAEGTHPDVYELDAASRTGVDNVREEIIGSVNFAPVRGAYKIYIIDEVHMLTTAAFNALLKTLEEPPAHVVFVLCTTDPQKIPETILSRCQRFDFHRIGVDDIVGRLTYICEQERFEYDAEALEIVAKHARGGMRDALSTLEQLSVFGDGAVRISDARSLLGEVPGAVLSDFTRALAERDTPRLFALVADQVDAGGDIMELTRDLVAHVRDVYKMRIAGAGHGIAGSTPAEEVALADEAGLFEGPDRLARMLTILDDAVLEMRSAPDMRLVLEIALTRLARPESDLTLEALADRIERLEARLLRGVPMEAVPSEDAHPVARAAGSAPSARHAAPATAPAGAPRAQAETTGAEGAGRAPAAQTAARTMDQPPRQAVRQRGPQQATPEGTLPTAAEVAASAAPETPAVSDDGELQRRWAEVVKRVVAAQPSRGALLQSARAQRDDGDTITVALPKGSTFAIKMLGRDDTQSVILPQVAAVFGRRRVQYAMDGAPAVPATRQAPPSSVGGSPAASQTAQRTGEPAPDRPASRPAPAAAPAPAPSRTDHGGAPGRPPEQGTGTAAPADPGAADAASGPTILPDRDIEADRQAWADDRVPYDDDAVACYEDDGDEEVPPFDMPAVAPESAGATGPGVQTAAAPAAEPEQRQTPFTHEAPAPVVPQTAEEAQELLTNIFGGGVVIKSGD